jgi:hypothetical protein
MASEGEKHESRKGIIRKEEWGSGKGEKRG